MSVISLQEIANKIDEELKLNSVGKVVHMFRSKGKIDILESALPYVAEQNKKDIHTALNGTLAACTQYYA